MYFLNDKYKNSIFFLSFLFSCLSGITASLPDSLIKTTAIIRSFESGKILNTSPNYSIVFEESGIMFLGQEDKISIYNGFSWTSIQIKGEILLTRNSLNRVFFAGENSIGYLTPDSLQQFGLQFLTYLLPANLQRGFIIREIESVDKMVFFRTDSSLFSYSSNVFVVLDNQFQNGKIFKCRDKLITLKPENHIDVFQNNMLEKSFVLPGEPVTAILEHEDGYLFITSDNKFLFTDNSFKFIKELTPEFMSCVEQGMYLEPEKYIFSAENNSLILCDKNGIIKSRIISIPGSDIVQLAKEKSGNIWVLQEKSLSRIEYPSPISIISEFPADDGNILDIKSFNNKIFIASTKGLFCFDPLENQYINTGITDFCYRLIPAENGMFVFTDTKVFLYNSELAVQLFKNKILTQAWDSRHHRLYLSEKDKIKVITFNESEKINSFSIYTPVKPLEIMPVDSVLWISDGESLYKLDKDSGKSEKIFVPDAAVIMDLFCWQNKLHILTNNRIYFVSGNTAVCDTTLSEEICNGEFINTVNSKEDNLLLLYQTPQENSIVWFGNSLLNTFSKITLPSYISLSNSTIDYFENNKLIISDGAQIFMFDINEYHSGTRSFETIIKKITAGNKVLFNGVSFNFFRTSLHAALNSIAYKQNCLRIELSTTNYLENKPEFQYFMNAEDTIWSEWSSNSFISLENLREGKYDLKIRSRDYMNKTSAITSIVFRINPPFYRSWLAYILYNIMAGVILFIAYKTYLLNIHKTRRITGPGNENQPERTGIPVSLDNTEPLSNKKFDFFSNLDEDKVKDKTRWDKYEMVTVLFSDIQGFTKIAESMNPELLIDELDRFFYHFDSVVEKYSIEKIKTIGDAYMAAGGIPKKSNTNPIEVVLAALEMQNYMKQLKKTKIDIWDLRIGIHSGPVIAGIIGHKKRSFDIWGDTVNTASRMETTGEAGKVNISGETYKFVKDYFICEYRGKLPVKYKGNIDMYFVKSLRPELSINLGGLPNRKFYLKLQMLRLNDLEEFVFSKLETELDKNLYFHNFEYVRHLYEYSGLLAKAADLDLEETLLIRTSALLINIGFTGGYENQENRSAEFARNNLPEFNYSEKQISIISNLILSSKWPPEPRNMLEMVLYDIKMEFIGRADFTSLYKMLFLEQKHYMKTIDKFEFKRKQTEIIQQYSFYTESARRLREVSLKEQLLRIKEDDWN